VDLDESMIRAIAKQAEAERNRRAKVISAEGELQASYKLAEAAGILEKQPSAITLRYLQTMMDMSHEKNQTIFFPFPVELLQALKKD
jgi:regulator of protease activity HflC (stomatin/prohibitin superfamily)